MAKSSAVILPGNVRPSRYILTLTPDFESFTFRGEETVELEVLEPTSSVVMNSTEIEIHSARLTLRDGSALTPAETDLSDEDETVTFRFAEDLPPGPARLDLDFTGQLNDKLRGFYRSRYDDQKGEQRHLATTQFEATDARRAFPCWDEPGLKARFQVTLLIPSEMVAVSNMSVAQDSRESDGLRRVTFAETPVMSTYLLAFVVGDFKSIEQRASGGTLIRVWATAGKEEQGRYALQVSLKLLDYFNEYFGIPYPLEKLDHLAIPDFAAGAMENWGAITYRENAILVDPDNSSAITRQIVASIVSHEMAHMWFGDLVTMDWWNGLWLNESFASWMGDKAVDHLFPDWHMWTQFVSSDTNQALSLDGLKSSHPIEQEVKNPAEIGQLFDAISYSKGGSVLRMLEHFLGADVFRRGLNRYLTRHQYANARTRDLWDALGEESGQPVAAMMDTWVQQTGYPVVDVQTNYDAKGLEVTASQNRFVYEHLLEPEERDATVWRLPLTAATAASSSTSILMDGRNGTMRLELGSEAADQPWVKVNPEQTGFYRVSYSAEDWSRLRTAIQRQELSATDRLGLQNDAYALSKAGYIAVGQFLALAGAYVDETDASVWEDLAANLGGLDSVLRDEPYHADFQAFARGIFEPVGGRVGWNARDGEGHLDALLRSTVLSALGDYGNDDAIAEAKARFAAYVGDADSVRPDIRSVVFNLAAVRGDRATYDTIWKLQKSSKLDEEKVRLLRSLTRFERPELLDETLERSLSDDVRVHETIRVVVGVASNRHGRDRAWEFVKANWSEFDRRYGEGGFALMNLVSMTSRFTTHDRLEDVERFFADHPTPAADRTIRQSLERVRLNIAWLDRNRAELRSSFGE